MSQPVQKRKATKAPKYVYSGIVSLFKEPKVKAPKSPRSPRSRKVTAVVLPQVAQIVAPAITQVIAPATTQVITQVATYIISQVATHVEEPFSLDQSAILHQVEESFVVELPTVAVNILEDQIQHDIDQLSVTLQEIEIEIAALSESLSAPIQEIEISVMAERAAVAAPQVEEQIDQHECYICTNTVSELVETCGQVSHMVCVGCMSKLKTQCPMCRQPLKTVPPQATDSTVTLLDGISMSQRFRDVVLGTHLAKILYMFETMVRKLVTAPRTQQRVINNFAQDLRPVLEGNSNSPQPLLLLTMIYKAFFENDGSCQCFHHRYLTLGIYVSRFTEELQRLGSPRIPMIKFVRLLAYPEILGCLDISDGHGCPYN